MPPNTIVVSLAFLTGFLLLLFCCESTHNLSLSLPLSIICTDAQPQNSNRTQINTLKLNLPLSFSNPNSRTPPHVLASIQSHSLLAPHSNHTLYRSPGCCLSSPNMTHSPQTTRCCVVHPYPTHPGSHESHHTGPLTHLFLSTLIVRGSQDNGSSIVRQIQPGPAQNAVGRAEPGFRGHCSGQLYTGMSNAVCRFGQSLMNSVSLSSPLTLTASHLVIRYHHCVVILRESASVGHRLTRTRESPIGCCGCTKSIGSLWGQSSDCHPTVTRMSLSLRCRFCQSRSCPTRFQPTVLMLKRYTLTWLFND